MVKKRKKRTNNKVSHIKGNRNDNRDRERRGGGGDPTINNQGRGLKCQTKGKGTL